MIDITVRINGDIKERIRIENTGEVLFGQTVHAVRAFERMPCPHVIHNPANGYWALMISVFQHFALADGRK